VFGAEPAWFSEIEDAPSKILAHHWPDVPNLGDITKIDWDQVEPVDILGGGFPCQDVSLAGKRAGMTADTRSGLWSYFAAGIAALRPQYVVIENVRGLLSAEAHSDVEPCPWCLGDGPGEPALRALGAVLGDLADLGYDAQWCGLRAADVGAPHGRYRSSSLLGTPARGLRHDGIDRWPPAGNHAGRLEGSGEPFCRRRPNLGHERRGSAGRGLGDGSAPPLNGEHCCRPRSRRTPREQGTRLRGRSEGSQHHSGTTLTDAVTLLPTPRATDGTKGGPNQRGSSGDLMLPSAVQALLHGVSTDPQSSGGNGPSAA
jgi:DNA (cytosine-5)-methyltransferase 1